MYPSTFSLYMADTKMTRAELAMLLAKTFRLSPVGGATFPDVPATLKAYVTKPVHGWIEAGAQNGLVKGMPSGLFEPHSFISREQAVAMLVRGLGLGPFAASLTPAEVMGILGRFRDSAETDPSLAPEMASAVFLRIVQGYPDGTLRPKQDLLRGEAAALVARSCLIRADARPSSFSPDGDGLEDWSDVFLSTLKNRAVLEWGVEIVTTTLHSVRSWYGWLGYAGGTKPPSSIRWNGSDWRGISCADGLYLYEAWVRDRMGNKYSSSLKPLYVERPCIWVFAEPSTVNPGQAISVTAYAKPNPLRVTLIENGAEMTLSGSEWRALLQVPLLAQEGTAFVHAQAVYASTATRTAAATYNVIDPFWLSASLSPQSAVLGQTARVSARTADTATGAQVWLPWQTNPVQMIRKTPHQWDADFVVPWGTAEGVYSIEVLAWSATKQRSVNLALSVDHEPLARFVTSLIQ